MFFVSDIYTTSPDKFDTYLQKETYNVLQSLNIQFQRVYTDEAITMEDCAKINEKLVMKMVKTLFLCNRQQTSFYLFITAGNKAFKAKDFSNALGVSRVSFAPSDLMEKMLGTKIGAATVFGVMIDNNNDIQVVFDKDIAIEEWYGCSDGTTTGYMKIKTEEIMNKFLPFVNHAASIIEV